MQEGGRCTVQPGLTSSRVTPFFGVLYADMCNIKYFQPYNEQAPVIFLVIHRDRIPACSADIKNEKTKKKSLRPRHWFSLLWAAKLLERKLRHFNREKVGETCYYRRKLLQFSFRIGKLIINTKLLLAFIVQVFLCAPHHDVSILFLINKQWSVLSFPPLNY